MLEKNPAELAVETRFSAVEGILLANRVVLAAPGDLNAEQRRALREITAAKKNVEEVREARATRQPAKVRPLVAPFNTAWAGLANVLAATAALPADVAGPKARRAQALRATIFPETGAPYLVVDAQTAWVEAKERVDRVARLGLEGELGEVIGPEHFTAAKRITAALGEALGVSRAALPLPSANAMQAALRTLARAIARYARRLLADLDEDDEASVARFYAALAPLEEHKLSIGTRGTGVIDEDADEPETPVTPAPAGPVTPVEPAAQ